MYGRQFGTVNNKHIVKTDLNLRDIQFSWFKDILWQYYTKGEGIAQERGMYLICDNGYLHWPPSICLYEDAAKSTLEGYFSTNLESVRKDVECTFGILKKRWTVLNNGLLYLDIYVCEKIFVMCCCLHNYLLGIMVWHRNDIRVGQGYPIGDDGLWLDYNTPINKSKTKRFLAIKFGQQRSLLVKHLRVFQEKEPITK